MPDQVDVHVGNRLRVRRTLLGISQEKLAGAIGLTFQQVQKYERGLNRISAGRLYQFSKILDIPVSYFYENINKAPQNALSDNNQEGFSGTPSQSGDLMQKKETIDLLRAYYSIDDENARKDILRFIRSMAQKSAANKTLLKTPKKHCVSSCPHLTPVLGFKPNLQEETHNDINTTRLNKHKYKHKTQLG